ncbi:MAG: HD domain-containing protein [Acidobacteria bacterium]|nr:MAG: HD domain-containing protein [Acidobacteriota bacterium]
MAEADRLGLIEPWLPESRPLRGLIQNRYHHLDAWRHTLAALAAADRPRRLAPGLLPPRWPRVPADPEGPPRPDPDEARLVLRWALLLHDLGKAATRALNRRGEVSFHGHETVGERIAKEVTRRLAFPGPRAEAVARLVRLHLRLVIPPEGRLSERALARIARAAGPYTELLALHALADQLASRGVGWRRTRRRLLDTVAALFEVEREIDARRRRGRLLTGRDVLDRLGIAPGPRVGEILREAERLRDLGELETREQALAWLERWRPDRA